MTLSIGNQRGLTLVELLITVVILSVGIVFIYKSFFICLDYMQSLASRWQAVNILNERIDDLSLQMRTSKDFLLDPGPSDVVVVINNKNVVYHLEVSLNDEGVIQGVYALQVMARWHDGKRAMSSSRQVRLIK